ncbi:hypothetical protein PHLCEN_2v12361 [Hermanssonia centrifuga]|uniref:Rab-GAP TBC domain-containing protein n=1 Tax=Hermanssonia centrifuga TaxID=98765 RepID=A0A2R6NH91_9APHY|nr:hypothetical protein PHLCEN_2v12361 [Hermanssonia centrifuga]
MPDEEAFCLLVRLMHSYDLRGHFLPEMPKLQLRMFQIGPEGADPKTAQYDIDLFVQDAVSMSVTPFMLDQYANEYEELVRTRDAHTIEVDGLRSSNRSLSNQIHNLEENLAQLNTEHVKVLNELVMARLRNEELESELVRYKLL